MVEGTGLENQKVNASQVRILSLLPHHFLVNWLTIKIKRDSFNGKTSVSKTEDGSSILSSLAIMGIKLV